MKIMNFLSFSEVFPICSLFFYCFSLDCCKGRISKPAKILPLRISSVLTPGGEKAPRKTNQITKQVLLCFFSNLNFLLFEPGALYA